MRLDEAARRYLGVPFQHQGRDPQRGIDCIGLVVLCERDCGGSPEDFTAYDRHPSARMLETALRAYYGPPVSGMCPGDLVAIRYAATKRGPVRHVAVVGEHAHGLSLIHTDSNIGRVVEHRLDDGWRDCIAGVYRRAAE